LQEPEGLMPATMSPFLALLTAFALVLASPANAGEGLPDGSLTDRIDSWVVERMEARGIPGVAVEVVQDGETIHLRGYGIADSTGRPVQIDTPFLIGSAGKPFTAHVGRQATGANTTGQSNFLRRSACSPSAPRLRWHSPACYARDDHGAGRRLPAAVGALALLPFAVAAVVVSIARS
jgi:hypothetical protein